MNTKTKTDYLALTFIITFALMCASCIARVSQEYDKEIEKRNTGLLVSLWRSNDPGQHKLFIRRNKGSNRQTQRTDKRGERTPIKEEVREKAKIASWYDYTLDGIAWSKNHLTCASRTLKRYATATVINLDNGKTVDCYVNDYIEHPLREIDLSSYAFSQIADLKQGLIRVKIIQ